MRNRSSQSGRSLFRAFLHRGFHLREHPLRCVGRERGLLAQNLERWSKCQAAALNQAESGERRLTTAESKRILPDLANYVTRCNSLIGSDYHDQLEMDLLDNEGKYRVATFLPKDLQVLSSIEKVGVRRGLS